MKNKIIICLCLLMFMMIIGYSALSTSLVITGTGNITTNWNVYFDSITTKQIVGTASNAKTPTASGLSATFDYNIQMPGDKIVYELSLKNGGTLNAVVSDIKASNSGTSELIYTIEGIKTGDILDSGTSKKITITVLFDPNATSIPETKNSVLALELTCVQYGNQVLTGTQPVIVPLRLTQAIFRDNTAQSDASVDFSKAPAEDGTNGLYYTSTNTEDNKTTYYFRGAVTNNYVKFANMYWRIIRINEDGSIRMIYSGKSATATGYDTRIGTSKFNPANTLNAYVGYMYGSTSTSASYADTHANINDSTVKTFIDDWYENNLVSYANYLADAGFCNDRSIASGTGRGSTYTIYNAYNRYSNKTPQFKCINSSNDLFTTNTSDKGNKALDYPIALVTMDESLYAGSGSYLGTGANHWAMTPRINWGSGSDVYVYIAGSNGGPSSDLPYPDGYSYSVRPVINLKYTIEITSGNGTSTNPYVIKTS